MELIEIEAFVAIAETGSFTRAADALRLSQPAVSRRIELLERELGAPLFARIRGGARLTAPGDAFLPFARQALAAVRDGQAAVAVAARGEEGTLAVALVGTLASTDLTARLRMFRVTYPGVRLVLRTARSDEVSALVERGDVALGLRYFPDSAPAIVSRLIGNEELVVVCASQSRLIDPAVTDVRALAGVPWVSFPTGDRSSGEPFARLLARQLLGAGLDGAEIIAVDSLTAQKRLIEADFGIGLLPASSVEEELRLGTLRPVPIAALAVTVPVVAIHRRAGYLGPAADRLLAALAANEPPAA